MSYQLPLRHISATKPIQLKCHESSRIHKAPKNQGIAITFNPAERYYGMILKQIDDMIRREMLRQHINN